MSKKRGRLMLKYSASGHCGIRMMNDTDSQTFAVRVIFFADEPDSYSDSQ